MKHQVYFGIAIRIIILFGIAMLFTFVPDQLRGFFGDIHIKDKNQVMGPDEEWTWGARHYWYYWGMFLLFILSLANVVIGIVTTIQKHYKDL